MPEFQPLYARIHARLLARITSGAWAPGALVPSEKSLAAELGVSLGTIRKATGLLCEDGALIRAQGRGTFVARQTADSANDRFLRLADDSGNRVVPALLRQIVGTRAATPEQAAALQIEDGAPVHLVLRVRTIDGIRAIDESVAVVPGRMPNFIEGKPLADALYPSYQARFGINVVRAEDGLTAISADARLARRLRIRQGAPLLRAERIAFDLTGLPVEHRVSHFVTETVSYSVTLR